MELARRDEDVCNLTGSHLVLTGEPGGRGRSERGAAGRDESVDPLDQGRLAEVGVGGQACCKRTKRNEGRYHSVSHNEPDLRFQPPPASTDVDYSSHGIIVRLHLKCLFRSVLINVTVKEKERKKNR